MCHFTCEQLIALLELHHVFSSFWYKLGASFTWDNLQDSVRDESWCGGIWISLPHPYPCLLFKDTKFFSVKYSIWQRD